MEFAHTENKVTEVSDFLQAHMKQNNTNSMTADECTKVRPHFRMANQLAQAINEAFKQQDIEWNDDCSDIIYDEEFLLIF